MLSVKPQNDASDAFDITGEGTLEDGATLNEHALDRSGAALIDDGCSAAVPDHCVGRRFGGRASAAESRNGRCQEGGLLAGGREDGGENELLATIPKVVLRESMEHLHHMVLRNVWCLTDRA